MPSIHVTLAVLFACLAFSLRPAFGWAMSGFAVLIWIGSVHLGWHYAIDGILGAAITLILWQAAGALVRVPEAGRRRTQQVLAPQPAGS